MNFISLLAGGALLLAATAADAQPMPAAHQHSHPVAKDRGGMARHSRCCCDKDMHKMMSMMHEMMQMHGDMKMHEGMKMKSDMKMDGQSAMPSPPPQPTPEPHQQ